MHHIIRISITLFTIFIVSLSTLVTAQVDINSASAKEIAQVMKSVGLKKAKRIVEFRSKFGMFPNINALAEVKGISQRIVNKNKHKIVAIKPEE